MGYEAIGLSDYPEDKIAVNLLLEQESFPQMDFVVNCVGYKRDEDENNWAPEKCIGEHYRNLCAVVFASEEKMRGDLKYIQSQLLGKLMGRAREEFPEAVHIGFMSRQGRHRSIALCRLTIEILKRKGFNVDKEPMHHSMVAWGKYQCSTCEECRTSFERKTNLYDIAVSVWDSLTLESLI